MGNSFVWEIGRGAGSTVPLKKTYIQNDCFCRFEVLDGGSHAADSLLLG